LEIKTKITASQITYVTCFMSVAGTGAAVAAAQSIGAAGLGAAGTLAAGAISGAAGMKTIKHRHLLTNSAVVSGFLNCESGNYYRPLNGISPHCCACSNRIGCVFLLVFV
jgi:hypothetical protein